MGFGKYVTIVAWVVLALVSPHLANGQGLPLVSDLTTPDSHHIASFGIKKFFNSFTSYQFPNPFVPEQDPLSRLEFPLDQWFLGLKHQYAAGTWSLFGQAWVNATRESHLKMQDSDWDDEVLLSQKTIFSESGCRLNKGLILDIGLTIPTPFRWARFLKPLMGWRYQHFFFTTHDGYQMALDGVAQALPGDGIDFKQTFRQVYFGVDFRAGLDLALISDALPRMVIEVQLDYAVVTAKNEDLHLLREGNRITTENTAGHCWHLTASLGLMRTGAFSARLEGDFKRLITNGNHRLSNIGLDFSFSGSKVWSDQTSLACLGEFLF